MAGKGGPCTFILNRVILTSQRSICVSWSWKCVLWRIRRRRSVLGADLWKCASSQTHACWFLLAEVDGFLLLMYVHFRWLLLRKCRSCCVSSCRPHWKAIRSSSSDNCWTRAAAKLSLVLVGVSQGGEPYASLSSSGNSQQGCDNNGRTKWRDDFLENGYRGGVPRVS